MMITEEKCETKCSRCRTYRFPSQFFNDKGRTMKTCQVCRDKEKITREKNKCEHGRQKSYCKDCGGTSICQHGKIRSTCRDCMDDEQKIEFIKKNMISSSRQSDKKYNRYDANNFIDHCFLTGLFEDSTNCYYCSVEFTYNERCDTLVTIERLNNSIGHIKSNCVLACWHCNARHKD